MPLWDQTIQKGRTEYPVKCHAQSHTHLYNTTQVHGIYTLYKTGGRAVPQNKGLILAKMLIVKHEKASNYNIFLTNNNIIFIMHVWIESPSNGSKAKHVINFSSPITAI